jgi:hypothetical protein
VCLGDHRGDVDSGDRAAQLVDCVITFGQRRGRMDLQPVIGLGRRRNNGSPREIGRCRAYETPLLCAPT